MHEIQTKSRVDWIVLFLFLIITSTRASPFSKHQKTAEDLHTEKEAPLNKLKKNTKKGVLFTQWTEVSPDTSLNMKPI